MVITLRSLALLVTLLPAVFVFAVAPAAIQVESSDTNITYIPIDAWSSDETAGGLMSISAGSGSQANAAEVHWRTPGECSRLSWRGRTLFLTYQLLSVAT